MIIVLVYDLVIIKEGVMIGEVVDLVKVLLVDFFVDVIVVGDNYVLVNGEVNGKLIV